MTTCISLVKLYVVFCFPGPSYTAPFDVAWPQARRKGMPTMKMLLTLLCLLLAGCIVSRNETMLVLGTEDSAVKQAGCHCELKGVSMPPYLDRNAVTRRQGGHVVLNVRGAKWAQALGGMVREGLGNSLALRSAPAGRHFQVSVSFRDFSLDEKDQLKVNASYEICEKDGGGRASGGFARSYKWNGKDMGALAALHDRAISELADALADACDAL